MPNNKGGKKYKKKKKETDSVRTFIKKENESEIYGQVSKICGNGRFTIRCTDGIDRLGIIRGKLRKKSWVTMGSIVLVDRWEFQDSKCSIINIYEDSDIDILIQYGEILLTFIKYSESISDFEEEVDFKTYAMPDDLTSDSNSDDEEIKLDDI